MNPASPGGKGLIYNYNAEHEVTDRENNVEDEEELVSDIKIEMRVYRTAESEISTK